MLGKGRRSREREERRGRGKEGAEKRRGRGVGGAVEGQREVLDVLECGKGIRTGRPEYESKYNYCLIIVLKVVVSRCGKWIQINEIEGIIQRIFSVVGNGILDTKCVSLTETSSIKTTKLKQNEESDTNSRLRSKSEVNILKKMVIDNYFN